MSSFRPVTQHPLIAFDSEGSKMTHSNRWKLEISIRNSINHELPELGLEETVW